MGCQIPWRQRFGRRPLPGLFQRALWRDLPPDRRRSGALPAPGPPDLQRGGGPTAADRLLATQYGCKVLDLVRDQQWDHMVALRNSRIISVPLSESKKERRVDPMGEIVLFAKSMGVSFGD